MTRMVGALAMLLGIWATSAVAHHPFDAEFDWKRPVTVTGSVTKFEWKDPHAVIEMQGKDEKGTAAAWIVELGPITQLGRAGWSRTQLKAGDQVSVDGWLAKDGTKKLSAKSVTPSGGRELFGGSSFFDMSRPTAQASTGTTGR